MIRGTIKADGLAVMRVEIDLAANPSKVKVVAAFINETLGNSVGFTESAGPWSPETLQKIRDLRDAFESDLARDLLVQREEMAEPSLPSGLGELLTSGAPQV